MFEVDNFIIISGKIRNLWKEERRTTVAIQDEYVSFWNGAKPLGKWAGETLRKDDAVTILCRRNPKGFLTAVLFKKGSGLWKLRDGESTVILGRLIAVDDYGGIKKAVIAINNGGDTEKGIYKVSLSGKIAESFCSTPIGKQVEFVCGRIEDYNGKPAMWGYRYKII